MDPGAWMTEGKRGEGLIAGVRVGRAGGGFLLPEPVAPEERVLVNSLAAVILPSI